MGQQHPSHTPTVRRRYHDLLQSMPEGGETGKEDPGSFYASFWHGNKQGEIKKFRF